MTITDVSKKAVTLLLGVGCIAGASLTATAGGDVKQQNSATIYSGVISGSVGREIADYTNRQHSFDELDDENYGLLQGEARINLPVGQNFSVQIDAGGFASVRDEDGDTASGNINDYFYTAAHLAYRNPHSHALGVFGLLGVVDGDESENGDIKLFGLEAQKYINNVTLYGQVGIWDADDDTERDIMTDAWFVRGAVRYFPTENSRLQVRASYAEGEENENSDDIDDFKTLSWGVQYDRKLNDLPVSWFVAYDGHYNLEYEGDNGQKDDSVESHALRVGLSISFGAETLLENDRRGATFDTPDVGRMTGWTLEVTD